MVRNEYKECYGVKLARQVYNIRFREDLAYASSGNIEIQSCMHCTGKVGAALFPSDSTSRGVHPWQSG